MSTVRRRGLRGTVITLGIVLALAAVTTSNTPVHASSAPDLWVDGLSLGMDLETPRVGGTIQMAASITNVGDQSSSATTIRFYRSSDATVTTADTQVATAEVSSLAADEGTDSAWVNITAPSTEGTYYYGACADVVTDETVTTNNCVAWSESIPVPLPRPDLVVQAPQVDDATLETGATFTLSATVAHAGDWSSDRTTLRYYRSTDETITTADTEVGTDDVDGLFLSSWASDSSEESVDLTTPSTVGTYYYGACVDSVIGESDTTNNCSSSVTVTVVLPSLTVSGSTMTSFAENGTGSVATYAATGAPSGATVTWSLSGDDSDDFSISRAGVLTFTSSPNYESPSDSDTNNVYQVTVEASATDRTTGTLDVTVTVTDVNEGVMLSGG